MGGTQDSQDSRPQCIDPQFTDISIQTNIAEGCNEIHFLGLF